MQLEIVAHNPDHPAAYAVKDVRFEVWGRVWSDDLQPHSREWWTTVLAREDDGTPMATAAMFHDDDAEADCVREQANIYAVSTHPGHRRKGAATACMRFLIDTARQRGVKRVWLQSEPAAIPLYEGLGFIRQDGGRDIRPDMVLDLEPEIWPMRDDCHNDADDCQCKEESAT